MCCLILAGLPLGQARGRPSAPPRTSTTHSGSARLQAWLRAVDGPTTGAPGASEAARQQALEALAKAPGPATTRAVVALLQAGQPDEVTEALLGVLAQRRDPRALDVLQTLSRHLRAEVRRLAYTALGEISHPSVPALLARGLSDSDAGVRNVCARALGRVGDPAQVDVLLVALERGVPEAAAAVGELAQPRDLPRYHALLERLPLETLLRGYAALLARDDLTRDVKLDIVSTLGEVTVPAMRTFLLRQQAVLKVSPHSALAEALRQAAARIAIPGSTRAPAPETAR